MAGPGIVGVQPVPGQQGAYNAQLANGQNMMVTGQAGQSLFDRFTKYAPSALAAVPGFGPAAAGLVAGAGALKGNDDMGGPPPGPAAPRVTGPTVPAAAAPGPGAAAVPGQAAPAPAPAQGAPPGAQPGPLGYTMKAVDPSTGREVEGPAMLRPDGTIGVYVPPRKGSPGGLTALGKGAVKASNEMEQQIAESRSVETQAREEGMMLAQEQAAREQAYHEEQKIQNMLTVQDQQDESAAIAERVAERQAKYDRLSAEARAGKVDENQYMRGAQGVFSALGSALGAFGAALARTPNFASDFVQSQIDRNIRRQEAELAMKGKAADNALGDLLREQGSLKDAKATLKQLMTERTAIEANVMASTAKDQAIAARAREVSAQLAGQVAIQDKARRQGDLEHVMTSRLYYSPGSAGSSGGFLPPTLQSRLAAQSLEAGAQGIEKTDQAMRIAEEKRAASSGPGGAKLSAPAAAQLAQIDAALAGLSRYDKTHKDLGRPGVLVRGGALAGEESQELTAQAQALGPVLAKALEGDAATAASMEAAYEGLLNKSGGQAQKSIDAYARQLLMRREGLLANPAAQAPTPEQPPQ